MSAVDRQAQEQAELAPEQLVPPTVVDRAVGATAVVAMSPLLAVRAAWAAISEGRVFDSHVRIGRHDVPISIPAFAGGAPGRRLAYVFAVARGDVRIIGPRPLHPRDTAARVERDDSIVPGLLSEHRLKARTGIDYENEPSRVDQTLWSRRNLTLIARYVVAEIVGGGPRHHPDHLDMLGIRMRNTTMQDALDWVLAQSTTPSCTLLAFVNPDCLNQAVDNPEYRAVLQQADRVLPDGIGIKVATRFYGVDVLENLNGTDMFPRLCERAAAAGRSIFLLGAGPGVADAAARQMRSRFPMLDVAGTRDGFFADEEEDEVVAQINASGADILFVAMGVPRQELWLQRVLPRLEVGVAMGVGGLFDFYSGRIPRAPQWLREMGLEWVWRLRQEPGRMWRRYVIGNPKFLWRVWQEAHSLPEGDVVRPERPPLLGYGWYGSTETPSRTRRYASRLRRRLHRRP